MKKLKKVMIVLCLLAAFGLLVVLGINFYVCLSVKNDIIKDDADTSDFGSDCILILGAGVLGDKPSPMLADRLDEGIRLYKAGAAPKIIVSGDHGTKSYDEVNVMKEYAVSHGVPSEDIFMDHAGFNTYDSLYRALHVFDAKSCIVVTQEYHLYRALYLADRIGIDAKGAPADARKYAGQAYREIREILARNKDFVNGFVLPQATIMGDMIPVSGNGDVTNDK